MRKLYKATAMMGISTFVAMVVGLARAKFLALQLGPEGVGIFSQALTFFQSIETVSALGIGLGVTNYVAEAWDEKRPERVGNIISSSCIMQLAVSIACLMAVVIFKRQVSQLIFSSEKYATLLVVSSVGVLFTPILVTLETTILGMGHTGRFSLARVIYYVLGLLVLMALVGGFNINGGFLFIAANALLSLVIVVIFVFLPLFKTAPGLASGIFKFNRSEFHRHFREIFSYGALMLITSAITWFSVLVMRSLVISREGASGNGLYQVVFALVGYYTPFFTNGVWGYLFPKLSATRNIDVFNNEVNKALRFVMLFVTPAVVALFLLKKELVVLTFSREFLGCLDMFPLYLLGSFFFLVSYIISTTFLARRQLKSYFWLNTCQNVLYVVIFAALAPKMGLLAIAVSYFAVNLLTSFTGAVYQARTIKFTLDGSVLKLLVLSVIFMLVEFFTPDSLFIGIFKWLLLAMWVPFVLGKKEKALFLSFIKRK